MADIDVNLRADGDLEKDAIAASKAMAKVAEEERRVSDIARKLGTTDLKMVSRAMKQAERDAAKASRTQAELLKQEAAARKRAVKETEKLARATAKLDNTADKGFKGKLDLIKEENRGRFEAFDLAKKLTEADVAGVAEVSLLAAGSVAVAAGFAAALGSAVALTGKVAMMAAEAGGAKQSAEAMFRVLEGSNAGKALAAVDAASEKLGVSLEKGRDRFIQFRKAGADNSVSIALSKLTADLDAVDPSGKLAEDAISKVLAKKNDDGTADLAAMREEMAKLATQAGVSGTGAEAMAAKVSTVGGALTRLDTAKTKTLEEIWDRISPTVSEAAQNIANAIEKFTASGEGEAAIEDIASAVKSLGSAVTALTPLIPPLVSGIASFVSVGSSVVEFGVRGAAAFARLGDGASALLQDFLGLPPKVSGAVESLLNVILNPFGAIEESMSSIGGDALSGLISGLSPARLLSHVGGLAKGALSKFKGILGIASPSKAFERVGESMGQGTTMGFADQLQSLPKLATGAVNDVAAVPPPAFAPAVVGSLAGASSGSTSGASASGGVGGAVVTINISGAQSPQETAIAVRREMQALFSAERLARGAA